MNTNPSFSDASKLLTPAETAERLGVSLSTLAKMRMVGGNLPFVKMHRAVRYRASDVDQYISDCLRGSTADSPPSR